MATTSLEIGAARELDAPGRVGSAVLRRAGDGFLVRMAARGDRQAFAAIFERYRDPLYRYCVSILGSSEDAADALQSTMAAALTAIESPRDQPRQLKAWLYRIAHNESISLLRRRRPDVSLEDTDLQAGRDTESEVATRTRLSALLGDLRDLPDGQRGAILMRELSGLSYEEIATALRISPSAAKQSVYDARVALHELEEGREMHCRDVRLAISDGDGRRLRGRKLRSHLNGCAQCAGFRDVMRTRQADLAVIAPMPAVLASGLLASILGGGGGGGGGTSAGLGALLGGAGKGTGAALGSKGLAIAASAAMVAGAGGIAVSVSDPANGARGPVEGGAAAKEAGRDGYAKPAAQKNSDKAGRASDKTTRKSKASGAESAGKPDGAEHGSPDPGGVPAGAGRNPVAGAAHPANLGLGIAGTKRPANPQSTGADKAAEGISKGEAGSSGAGSGASPPIDQLTEKLPGEGIQSGGAGAAADAVSGLGSGSGSGRQIALPN